MTRHLFFITFLLLPFFISAQNYRVFPENAEIYFSQWNYNHYHTRFDHIVRTDSSVVMGNDIWHYNYKVARIDTDNEGDSCYFSFNDNSWLGEYYIEHPGNEFTFFNKSGDSIIIRPNASNWRLFTFPTGDYFEANYIGTIFTPFVGGPDSVRVIRLSYFLASGYPTPHYYDQFELHFSKNQGLILTFDFREFPATAPGVAADLHIAGRLGRFGTTNLEHYQFVNFQVGDIFQTEEYRSDLQFTQNVLLERRILTRGIVIGGGTFEYEVERKSYGYTDNPGYPRAYFWNKDTLIENYRFTGTDLPFNLLPHQSSIDTSQLADDSKYPAFYQDMRYNSRLLKEQYWLPVLDPARECYDDIQLLGPKRYFGIDGVGADFYYTDLPPSHNYERRYLPTYFKKGTETWGTKVNLDSLIAIVGIKETLQPLSVSVFPNPASGQLWIDFPANLQNGRVEIRDITGRKMIDSPFLGKANPVRIDISELPNRGVYLYRISAKGFEPVSGKLLIH